MEHAKESFTINIGEPGTDLVRPWSKELVLYNSAQVIDEEPTASEIVADALGDPEMTLAEFAANRIFSVGRAVAYLADIIGIDQ